MTGVITGATGQDGSYLIELSWDNDGAINSATSDRVLKISPKFFRPCEVDQLLGDSTKVSSIGWEPEFTFETLIEDMVLNNSSLKN